MMVRASYFLDYGSRLVMVGSYILAFGSYLVVFCSYIFHVGSSLKRFGLGMVMSGSPFVVDLGGVQFFEGKIYYISV